MAASLKERDHLIAMILSSLWVSNYYESDLPCVGSGLEVFGSLATLLSLQLLIQLSCRQYVYDQKEYATDLNRTSVSVVLPSFMNTSI